MLEDDEESNNRSFLGKGENIPHTAEVRDI